MSFTIRQIRSKAESALSPIYGTTEAAQLVKMLFEYSCAISGASFALRRNEFLPQGQHDKFLEALQQLLHHVPIQYIIGSTWFYNLNIEVNPAVLIPRPETEEMVDLIVAEARRLNPIAGYRLLDIGTGSGCIAVALKKSLPQWDVEACDISEEALLVARRNAENAGTGIKFTNTDILQWKEWQNSTSYQLIVSNPPYVCEQEKSQMMPNVLDNEPGLALYVPDDDPLLFYRSIAEFSASHLVKGGKLYLEINENFGSEMVILLESHGYSHIELRRDFRGKDRFVTAKKA